MNLRKHGVGFAEASTVFGDVLSVTEKAGRIRLISARTATKHEKRAYAENQL